LELVDDDIELVLDLVESLVDIPDEMCDPKRDGKDAGNECPDKKSYHWRTTLLFQELHERLLRILRTLRSEMRRVRSKTVRPKAD
jgi:hypothetical protein